jgi:hypothetical protein
MIPVMEKDAHIFRHHSEEIWQQLSRHLTPRDGAPEWDGKPIRVVHGPFVLVLDVHSHLGGYATEIVTRLRAAYINRDGFRFRVFRHSPMADLVTRLGAQDVKIGDDAFDREFVIKATDEEKVRRLLARPDLRAAMLESRAHTIEVKSDEGTFGPDFPDGVDELLLEAPDRITAVGEIDVLYGIFAELLNRLCHLGSAYEDDPQLQL